MGEPKSASPVFQGLDADGLLTALMAHAHPWTDAPIIELLKGRFGPGPGSGSASRSRWSMASPPTLSSARSFEHVFSRSDRTLARDCGSGHAGRTDELLGGNRSKEKTGPSGQWLDVLANHRQRGAYPGNRTTFVAQLGAFSRSPIVKDLADITDAWRPDIPGTAWPRTSYGPRSSDFSEACRPSGGGL